MSSNLSAEEAAALAAALPGANAAAKSASVAPRQFDQPLRLSASDLDGLRERLRKALKDIERELAAPLRSAVKLELVDASEVSAEGLASAQQLPFAALRFEIAKQPGWLTWTGKAPLDALEVALGAAAPGENQPRRLSPVEQSTLLRLLGGATKKLAASVALEASTWSVAQDVESFGSWRQGGERAEAQRVRVVIGVQTLGSESQWQLYLPGVTPTARTTAKLAPQAPLPQHLGAIPVELRVVLGSAQVPLAQLLALEPGDVIPLDCELGDSLIVSVEQRACMRAQLGQSRGNLAVRIESIQRPLPGA